MTTIRTFSLPVSQDGHVCFGIPGTSTENHTIVPTGITLNHMTDSIDLYSAGVTYTFLDGRLIRMIFE